MFQSFYGDRFGYEVIEIVKDSNTVERDKLDPNKVSYYYKNYFMLHQYR